MSRVPSFEHIKRKIETATARERARSHADLVAKQKQLKAQEAATPRKCSTCGEMKAGCKNVGEKLICGKCRYDYAIQQEENKKLHMRRMLVADVLLSMRFQEMRLGMAAVFALAGFTEERLCHLAAAVEAPTREEIDAIWTVIRENNLVRPEASEFDPRPPEKSKKAGKPKKEKKV